jgi:pimeloyl-ACP methyl ester carboxylesterase
MRVDVGEGVRLFFDVVGSNFALEPNEMRERPVLLLLHGGPGVDHAFLRPYFDRFSDTHCLVYFDHRGNGRSDGRDNPSGWELDTWADDVSRLCDVLEIRSPVILGVSFGGTVAMHAAGRHPALPSKLVLVSSSAHHGNDARLDAFERLGGEHARQVAQRYYTTPTRETLDEFTTVCYPLYTQRKPEPVTRGVKAHSAVANHYFARIEPILDLTASVAAIRCPTLVLVGEQDPVTPPVMAERIAETLSPDLVRLQRFEGCGHGTHRDEPARTEAVIRDFLSS